MRCQTGYCSLDDNPHCDATRLPREALGQLLLAFTKYSPHTLASRGSLIFFAGLSELLSSAAHSIKVLSAALLVSRMYVYQRPASDPSRTLIRIYSWTSSCLTITHSAYLLLRQLISHFMSLLPCSLIAVFNSLQRL